MTDILLFTSSDQPLRSMGVAKVATLFRDNGFNVETIDFIDFWSINDLENVFKKLSSNLKMIGISSNFVNRNRQKEIIKFSRMYAPNAILMSGGQAHTTRNEKLGFNLIITSYVDNAIDDIIKYIETGNIQHINGVEKSLEKSDCWYLDASKYYPSQSIGDLAPRYNNSDVLTPFDYLGIEFGRGCRFKCKFCNYPFLGIKESTTVTEQEIEKQFTDNYEKWGITNYIINDSTFNDRTEKIELLAQIIKKLPFEINLSAYIRMDLLVRFPEQVKLLAESRVWAHWYGTETFHPLAAKTIGKGMPIDKIKQGMMDVKKYFMSELGLYRSHSSLIAGLPYEPPSSWEETERWHLENYNDQSRSWFSLELPSIDAPEVEHSVFTRNTLKYNIFKMQDLERLEILSNQGYRTANYSMPWKHDTADLLDAWTFKNNFDKTVLPTLPVNNFAIIPLNKFLSRNELLTYTNSQRSDTNFKTIIQKQYIKNKMNYLGI